MDAQDEPKPDAEVEESNEPKTSQNEFESIDFVTLGMFIIDEIEYLPPTPPVKDIVGGAGTYSALGARLFSAPPLSRSVGWIVDKGSDFPPALEELIATWETSVLMRQTPERLTTRGWNGYDEHQRRAFRYVTPKKRLTAEDLTPALLASRSFHLICSPTRCRELVTEIKARRHALCNSDGSSPNLPRPIFIWEPVPDLCTPDELLNCTNTLPLVDVCSPNHAELAGFMGDSGLDPETGEISTRAVERACEQLLGSMPLQSFALVVRAGEKGCYLARNGGRKRKTTASQQPAAKPKKPSALLHGGLRPDTDMFALFAGLLQDPETGAVAREEIEVDPGVERWIPAYHRQDPAADDDDASSSPSPDDGDHRDGDDDNGNAKGGSRKSGKGKVVDPTGGGNAFLGGLAVALARGKSLEEAAAWASVAASFAIEQVGVPVLGADAEGRETWNGVRVEERFEEFKTTLAFS
ncbi:hypothetical protein DL764_008203 [Monosporascus ibericus]|uniref:Carbohydrate kinase PfkB domain-containing protein n=1 Tax=Monosporascus ibericus TaxID=155417 RepID=A0A4Q4SY35_9PEZI|nr:hypothetical protein DL764_008203 [Monosporascus ibericus]